MIGDGGSSAEGSGRVLRERETATRGTCDVTAEKDDGAMRRCWTASDGLSTVCDGCGVFRAVNRGGRGERKLRGQRISARSRGVMPLARRKERGPVGAI